LHCHTADQHHLLLHSSRVTGVRSCNSFTTRQTRQRALQRHSRHAAPCSATSEAGQGQELRSSATDAGKLYTELSEACTELKRAPPSMVRDALSDPRYGLHILAHRSLGRVLLMSDPAWTVSNQFWTAQKYDASGDVLAAMKALKEAGALPKWGKLVEDGLIRRNVFLGDLKQVRWWLDCTRTSISPWLCVRLHCTRGMLVTGWHQEP
jgi:hypothetical protein